MRVIYLLSYRALALKAKLDLMDQIDHKLLLAVVLYVVISLVHLVTQKKCHMNLKLLDMSTILSCVSVNVTVKNTSGVHLGDLCTNGVTLYHWFH